MSIKLSECAARTDLSDRECAKILGATIGGLLGMAKAENVLRAVQWWCEHPEAVTDKTLWPSQLRGQ